MKELKKPINKEFPPLKLYLDDVRDIYNILQKTCKDKVTVTTEKYELSEIAELMNLGPKDIHELEFVCYRPHISLVLYPYSARLWISESSTENKGVASEIEDILSKCKRKFTWIFLNTWFGGMFVSLAFIILLLFSSKILPNFLLLSLVLLLVVYGLYLFWGSRLSLKLRSTIVLSERREAKNFLTRNKDQIVVGVIIAIVTAVVTALLTLLVSGIVVQSP